MRIISGYLKGRRLQTPIDERTRPTTDRAKEGLFNMLAHQYEFEELSVLDMFSGSGAIAVEFISRGAKHVVALERSPKIIGYLEKIKNEWELENLTLHHSLAEEFIQHSQSRFDIAFLDPPYAYPHKVQLIQFLLTNNRISPEGIVILEHSSNEYFHQFQGFVSARVYGSSTFSFFSPV